MEELPGVEQFSTESIDDPKFAARVRIDRWEQFICVREIYVSGPINHFRLLILLDTGATSSVLNEETWKKRGHYRPELLQKTNAVLTAANGNILAV